MANLQDLVTNFKEGPATLYITPYNSVGDLVADDIIVGFALSGVETTMTQTFRSRTADSVIIAIKKVFEGMSITGSAICQDMSPNFINQFIGGDLITDGSDATKTRMHVETDSPFKMLYGANIKIVDIANTDEYLEIVKAEVFISSLDISKSTKKDMTFKIDFEGVYPNTGTTIMKYGSVSAV